MIECYSWGKNKVNSKGELSSEISIESCASGQIYWNNPKGWSYVTFKSDSNSTTFQVCITNGRRNFESFVRTDSGEKFDLKDYDDNDGMYYILQVTMNLI